MPKGNYVLAQKPRPDLGLNYAGLRILPGESYGGKPEWTDPDCPETLSGTGGRRKVVTVRKRKNLRQSGFGAGYWDVLRNSPEKMAEHLRKMKEGRERHKAEIEAKKKTHGKWVKGE
jgi:hypothetical protein